MTVAADTKPYVITIVNHQFVPKVLGIPADKKIKIILRNQDVAAAEFESHALNREKIIPAKSQVVMFVGPLKPGKYEYFNDFNRDVTGIIWVK